MLSQVRAGGIDLLAVPSLTLSTLVPMSGLPSIGFAFGSYDQVWAAMDGGVGDTVREAIGKAGIIPMKKNLGQRFPADNVFVEQAAQQCR